MSVVIYPLAVILIIVFVLVPLAVVNSNAMMRDKVRNMPEKNTEKPVETKNQTSLEKPTKKKVDSKWVFSERNLSKALLKGRRRGHLRVMYHGQYYNTGLFNRNENIVEK